MAMLVYRRVSCDIFLFFSPVPSSFLRSQLILREDHKINGCQDMLRIDSLNAIVEVDLFSPHSIFSYKFAKPQRRELGPWKMMVRTYSHLGWQLFRGPYKLNSRCVSESRGSLRFTKENDMFCPKSQKKAEHRTEFCPSITCSKCWGLPLVFGFPMPAWTPSLPSLWFIGLCSLKTTPCWHLPFGIWTILLPRKLT